MGEERSGATGPVYRTGEYPNSGVDAFADPPPENSRWIGWFAGSLVLLMAVVGRVLVLAVGAVIILSVTAALAWRERRSSRR